MEGRNGKRGRGSQVPVRRSTPVKSQADALPAMDYRRSEQAAAAIQQFLLSRLSGRRGSEPAQCLLRVPDRSVTFNNSEVRSRHLWGCDVYTDDSDMAAVLIHCGYFAAAQLHNPPGGQEYHAVLTVMHPLDSYPMELRYNLRSRAWGAAKEGCCFKVERCSLLLKNQQMVDLEPCREVGYQVEPTFLPAAHERSSTSRSSSSSFDRRQRGAKEVTLLYNLCNEPWLKYSMATMADRGLKPSQWTSMRLQAEVLLLETHRCRFELSRVVQSHAAREASPEGGAEVYRWARCKEPLPLARMQALGLPLPGDQLEVLEARLQWEELQWGNDGVVVNGRFYQLQRLQFVERQAPQTGFMLRGKASGYLADGDAMEEG